MGLFGFGKKKLTPAQKQLIYRQEKILADSLKIIQNTDKLDTFFSRYNTVRECVHTIEMIAGPSTKCIAQNQASAAECAESLDKEFSAQLNNCIARYIKKETVHIMGLSRGRMSKAKGVAAIIEEYGTDMPGECLENARRLTNQLIKKIEEMEAG